MVWVGIGLALLVLVAAISLAVKAYPTMEEASRRMVRSRKKTDAGGRKR